MSNQIYCKTCKYYEHEVCKRYPPQCATAVPQRHQITQQVVPMMIVGFPQVNEDDWCGEWSNGAKLMLAS
jgi:hypothetical protein